MPVACESVPALFFEAIRQKYPIRVLSPLGLQGHTSEIPLFPESEKRPVLRPFSLLDDNNYTNRIIFQIPAFFRPLSASGVFLSFARAFLSFNKAASGRPLHPVDTGEAVSLPACLTLFFKNRAAGCRFCVCAKTNPALFLISFLMVSYKEGLFIYTSKIPLAKVRKPPVHTSEIPCPPLRPLCASDAIRQKYPFWFFSLSRPADGRNTYLCAVMI